MFYNLELERCVLGSMLLQNSVIPKIMATIDDSVFFDIQNRNLYLDIVRCYKLEGAVDIVTLYENFSSKASYLSELINCVPSVAHAMVYAKKLLKLRILRKSIEFAETAKKLAEDGSKDIDGYIAYLITAASTLNDKKSDNEYSQSLILDNILSEIETNRSRDHVGIPTGIESVDNLTGGIQKGHFWVVGAYTSVGKTAFALQIMLNMMKQGKSVVMLSNEMTSSQIGLRLLGNLSEVSPLKLQHGRYLDRSEYASFIEAKEQFKSFNLTVIENMHSLDKVLANIKLFEKSDCIFIDYLGQIIAEGKSEYEQLTKISREIQAAAMNSRVPIIALSQVSNESIRSKSQVIGYKGSGNIAAAADVGIELYRDKEDSPEGLDIIIRKNRHGATGSSRTSFSLKSGRIA